MRKRKSGEEEDRWGTGGGVKWSRRTWERRREIRCGDIEMGSEGSLQLLF